MKTTVKTPTKKEATACSVKKSSKKVTKKEIKEANERINPDENSMESRG